MIGNGPWRGWRKVKHESWLDPGFPDEIAATIPGGYRLHECIQCGTCSAVCPVSSYMDLTPRRLIAMTRAGFREDVLNSTAIWLCASCYACTTECPKQIPITDIMYALKRIAMREGTQPRGVATPFLARAFVRPVERWGRTTEARLATRLQLNAGPLQVLKSVPLGLRLLRRGRLNFGRESIRRRAQLGPLLRSVDGASGAPAAAAKHGHSAPAAVAEVAR